MDTKQCTSCKKSKPLSEFHKRSAAKDGLQSVCKQCNKDQRKAYYKTARGRDIDTRNARISKYKLQGKVYGYLRTQSCADCGESDPIVLDFDHDDPGKKLHNISEMVRRGMAWSKIENEISKCTVRCANCHRRRTAVQFGWRLAMHL